MPLIIVRSLKGSKFPIAAVIFAVVGTAPSYGGNGVPIPNGTWTMVQTRGVPAATNGWEQLVYVPPLKQAVMLSLYHQRYSEPNESLVGYNFETNSWSVLDMGGLIHTENMPEGGESQGYFDFNPNTNTLVYHCCTTGSNQPENPFHTWWFDVLGQSGVDKHTSPKPPFSALQPGGAFDVAHNVLVVHGGDSFVGTWLYDPTINTWQHPAFSGDIPNPSLILPGMAYSFTTHKTYLFGGCDAYGCYSDLYELDVPSSTWRLITPNGAKPPGRYRHGFAYDSTNNVFMVYGGQNGSTMLGDTWIYDPAINQWAQLTSPRSPPVTNAAIFARLAYDRDHNVFILTPLASGGYFGGAWTAYAMQTWLFRYKGVGPNAGTVASNPQPSAGSLNRNASSWGKDPALASNGSTLYVGWSETGSPFDTSNAALPHIYVSQYSAGAWIPVGSVYNSISADIKEAHSPAMAVINNRPWISWYDSNSTTETARVEASSWDGATTWSGSALGIIGGPPAFQGRSQVVGLRGIPHVALMEIDKSYYPQRTFVYVKEWNGTSWMLKGGALNRGAAGTTADSVSITTDGTTPYVAWTEYSHSYGGTSGDTDSNPQLYVSYWNGMAWVALGGSININPSRWAYDAAIAYSNGEVFVAWTERTVSGNAQLFVKVWNGTSWSFVGSGTLNRNATTGWAYHPSFAVASASRSLYISWIEQSGVGKNAQVYVSRYASGSWTALGGSLNVDVIQGSAERASIGVFRGNPVVAWAELKPGTLRQIYAKQWNRSTWVQLAGLGGAADTTPPTAPTTLTATATSPSSIDLTWSPSTDTVGVDRYRVFRGGQPIADVTMTFDYLDTGLIGSTAYSYTVVAYDAAGNASAASNVATATTP
jgi:hypothetical protein